MYGEGHDEAGFGAKKPAAAGKKRPNPDEEAALQEAMAGTDYKVRTGLFRLQLLIRFVFCVDLMLLLPMYFSAQLCKAAAIASSMMQRKAEPRPAPGSQGLAAIGQLGKLKVDDLKKYCKLHGLKQSGKKAELEERVSEHVGKS